MKKQPKQFDDDDGRVIASMDVEGTRWHDKKVRREQRETRQVNRGDQLSKSEARRYTWYAVLAGLLIATVFSAVWVLFILFCINVWFR